MIQSMTGFGKSEVTVNHRTYSIVLKSVNSKNADLNIKLPSLYRDKENDVRTVMVKELQRGKVDLYLSYDSGVADALMSVNKDLFKAYLADLKKAAENLDVSDDALFSIASKMPNILSQEKEEFDENDWQPIYKAIVNAIDDLCASRKQEGGVLEKDLTDRVLRILSLLEDIRPFEKERIETVKNRLESQLEQVSTTTSLNRDRFEQELIYYFEKLDITEEKVRLTAHCKLFMDTMNAPESQGRKLNFIGQEMGREINTIGSKANHAEIQKIVVEMKDELEKIKEQLFNIL